MPKTPTVNRGWRVCAALSFILVMVPGVAYSNGVELFGQFTVQAANEPESIKNSIDRWGKHFDQGERQWLRARAELGMRWFGWELSIFNRAQADFRINDEAARFYGVISRGEAFAADQQIPVTVEVQSFTAKGIRLGHQATRNNLKIRAGLSVFQSDHLYSGTLDGAFKTIENNRFELSAEVDYRYHKDVLLRRPNVQPAQGNGFSADFSLEWQTQPGLRIEISGEDLAAQIRWRDAPFTRATANTEQRRTGNSGFSGLKPAIEGSEGYLTRYTQRLSPRYESAFELGEGYLRPRFEAIYQFDEIHTGIGFRAQGHNVHEAGAMIYPKYRSLGLFYRFGSLTTELSADSLRDDRIGSVSIAIKYGY